MYKFLWCCEILNELLLIMYGAIFYLAQYEGLNVQVPLVL